MIISGLHFILSLNFGFVRATSADPDEMSHLVA